MTPDTSPVDVSLLTAAAHHFFGDSDAGLALLRAMVSAEGGTNHTTVKAVQCSIPSIVTVPDALDVFCRSAAHAAVDFIAADQARAQQFIAHLGSTWAPLGVANDPHGLNANWIANVLAGWVKA